MAHVSEGAVCGKLAPRQKHHSRWTFRSKVTHFIVTRKQNTGGNYQKVPKTLLHDPPTHIQLFSLLISHMFIKLIKLTVKINKIN